MNPLPATARALARVGDATDATTLALRHTPGHVRTALAVRRHRRVGGIAAIAVLLVYLTSIGDLAISTAGRWSAAPLVRAAPQNVLDARAAYLFEPVLAITPSAHVAVFLSPLNLLLGAVVAALVGANVAIAGYAASQAACRRPGYGRLLGVLPAFLLGFACCAPTVLLLLGTGTAAALLPALLPLRPVFYPLTLVLLTASLAFAVHRLTTAGTPAQR